MTTVAVPSIDEDIWHAVWDQERAWREEGSDVEQAPEPLALVIFGATGDLAHRKLVPALFSLATSNLLPDKLAIIGFGRSGRDEDDFRQGLRDALNASGKRVRDDAWKEFAAHISYMSGHYDDVESFHRLSAELDRLDETAGTANHRLFYLATPPSAYADIVRQLGASGLNVSHVEDGWARIIVEKPFGHDLESARALNHCIHEVFQESQIYRIDHYLGKETVQNIFVLRFVNGIFEPLWNRRYVDNVQITVAETLGVEGRGGYYDTAGAARDMLQSHLLQLLTLTAMEPPSTFTANKVRDEKVKVLDALTLASDDDVSCCVVRGQYGRGMIDGRAMPGYRDEPDVAPNSITETYVAAKLMIDNWRWAGVPFYLRTGKRLPKTVSEVAIQFRRAPHVMLPKGAQANPHYNVLVLRIQPDDGLALRIDVKAPGPGMRVRPVDMSFLYKDAFGSHSPDAYERLLLDAMRGDSTLFARTDEVEMAWALVTHILNAWSKEDVRQLPVYPAGTWGPAEADELLARDGCRWRKP
ncbi:MAG TPA: glucose-6-phosphate dehydrogenase [Chloroflexota bacterium]|nr:glucose-6-phosphate dehydrogenase [Chloroflexota bacterium]